MEPDTIVVYGEEAAKAEEIKANVEIFNDRFKKHLALVSKLATIWEDAIKHDVEIPYDAHKGSLLVPLAQYKNDEETNEYVLDEEATVKEFAKVAQWASSRGYKVEKKYSDNTFDMFVTVDESIKLNFYSTRQVVCKKVVTGTKIVPEQTVEEVEWVCDKIAFLSVEI